VSWIRRIVIVALMTFPHLFLLSCKPADRLTSADSEAASYPSSPDLKFVPQSGALSNELNPLAKDLYKVATKALVEAQKDLFDLGSGSRIASGLTLDVNSDTSGRLAKLGAMNIGDLTSAPGETFVRQKDHVIELVKKFRLFKKSDQKIILNIVTDNSNGVGKVGSVDVWTGGEQLVALMRSGLTSISQIPRENLVILVNGCTSQKRECWKHWVRAAGVDLRMNYDEDPPKFQFKHLPNDRESIEVEGYISNYKLGSRTSLASLNRSLERKMPKISISIITGDPPHSGHLGLSKYSTNTEKFDEAIILVNDAGHKKASSFVHRSNMTSLLADSESQINVMQRMYKKFDDAFGRDALVERMQNLYGTTDVYILEGQDGFERNLQLHGGGLESKRAKYLVFPRKGSGGPIAVPDALKTRVRVAQTQDELGLSSSLLRDLLKKGDQIKSAWLTPKVAKYIEDWKLFGAKAVKLIP
jgi:nicotinic acid mononucleotide adenylyltransferase